MKQYLCFTILLTCLLFQLPGYAQPNGTRTVKEAIQNNDFVQARQLLQTDINFYLSHHIPDSLVEYIYYSGVVWTDVANAEKAHDQVQYLLKKIQSMNPPAPVLKQAYIEAGEYYGYMGNNQAGYLHDQQALKIAHTIPDISPSKIALIENNLATFAQRLGNFPQAALHTHNAINFLNRESHPDPVVLHNSYNGMGAIMWYTGRLDSAQYYFELSLKTIKGADSTPENRYYRPAILYNNLAGIYNLNGNVAASLEAQKSCIQMVKEYLEKGKIAHKRKNAVTLQFEAIDNLAGIYKSLENYSRAAQLLEYSYQKKKETLPEDNPGIFISQILLGQIYYAQRDMDKALQFLNNALDNFNQLGSSYAYWKADAYYTVALIYDTKKNDSQAAIYYEKSDSTFEVSFGGQYDAYYLDFLRNKARFYAERGDEDKAEKISLKSKSYIAQTEGTASMGMFAQLLNLSNIYLISGDNDRASSYAQQSLNVLAENMQQADGFMDSLRMEVKKPKAILYKVKAAYRKLDKKTKANISGLIQQLEEGIALLEKRKILFSNAEDTRMLMAENSDLFEFTKQLYLDLYRIDPSEKNLNNVLDMQESVLYTHIRSRLATQDNMQYAHVPESILTKEKKLVDAFHQSLLLQGHPDKALAAYHRAERNWAQFRDQLKKQYPRYFKIKYAKIISALGDIKNTLPENATLIRYFFSDSALYAFVSASGTNKIIPLPVGRLHDLIQNLNGNNRSGNVIFQSLHQLYNILWKPLRPYVHTGRVIIIPDGILYALNFEMLTPDIISDFRALATHSILATHTVSYNYSLFLLDNKENSEPLQGFIGYAPGFFDGLKNNYRSNITDSMEMDLAYLHLMPQPFTGRLIEKLHSSLSGKAYTRNECTRENFVRHAGGHQIIHIGTHAAASNINPGRSNLIFAKNNNASEENILYANEIYHYNFNSELTVLAACETGTPGFQAGEGMISLANAFNYSGSKSMITSLWKIDEKASAILLEHFYKFLVKGMDKDEALRQAKLKYLSEANGRMLQPRYWAGLVLFGDTSPLKIEEKSINFWWYIGGSALLIILLLTVKIMNKKRK